MPNLTVSHANATPEQQKKLDVLTQAIAHTSDAIKQNTPTGQGQSDAITALEKVAQATSKAFTGH